MTSSLKILHVDFLVFPFTKLRALTFCTVPRGAWYPHLQVMGRPRASWFLAFLCLGQSSMVCSCFAQTEFLAGHWPRSNWNFPCAYSVSLFIQVAGDGPVFGILFYWNKFTTIEEISSTEICLQEENALFLVISLRYIFTCQKRRVWLCKRFYVKSLLLQIHKIIFVLCLCS